MTIALDEAATKARFLAKIEVRNGCWVWVACRDPYGYGQFRHQGVTHRAHRFGYQLLVGDIPDGLVLDHLCRNRACVNPDHLEPVTQRENVRRSGSLELIYERRAARTHCKRGHEYNAANTYIKRNGARDCRRCKADRQEEKTAA